MPRSIPMTHFHDAVPRMLQEMRDRFDSDCHFRWVGVTHESGWPVFQRIALDWLEGHHGGSLNLELATLAPNGAIAATCPRSVQDMIAITHARIWAFASEYCDELARRSCNLTLRTFDERPTYHALLLNADLIFDSPTSAIWSSLVGPEAAVEVITPAMGLKFRRLQEDIVARLGRMEQRHR